jgi:glyoxylate reductase
MPKPKVLVTRVIAQSALLKLSQALEVEVWDKKSPPPYDFLLDKIAGLDGILTLLTDPLNKDLISKASSRLKVISQMAVGFDNIDIKTATALKIPVGHTPGVLTETTADFTFAMILAASRRVAEGDRQVRQGIWEPWGPDILTGQEVFGSTLGIIGFGRIGQAVAQRARGFKMKILYYDKIRQPKLEAELGVVFAEMDQLLNQSDFITLHTNLSAETLHFINQETFNKMKSTAILINTSRGGVIDSLALIEALQKGKIRAAALDVYEVEPIPQDNPLLKMENVIITPHIASASIQTRERMALMAAENLLAGVRGEKIPYCANPEVYQ